MKDVPSKFAQANEVSWSPLHELVPEVPLRHGHAISIDMAYSATLANMRGILSDSDHQRILGLFSKAGLSMDHHEFDEELLDNGTKAILRTRDGKLRAAVPSPLGSCVFLNDVEMAEMYAALRKHKELMKNYPRHGEGLEAFVDASDTGYTLNGTPVEANGSSKAENGVNGHANGKNGAYTNGTTNGSTEVNGKQTNGVSAAIKNAAGADTPEYIQDKQTNGASSHTNGTNGHTNGY